MPVGWASALERAVLFWQTGCFHKAPQALSSEKGVGSGIDEPESPGAFGLIHTIFLEALREVGSVWTVRMAAVMLREHVYSPDDF